MNNSMFLFGSTQLVFNVSIKLQCSQIGVSRSTLQCIADHHQTIATRITNANLLNFEGLPDSENCSGPVRSLTKIYCYANLLCWVFSETRTTVLDRLEVPNSNPNPPKCRKGSIKEDDEFSEKMKSFSTFLVGTETSIFFQKVVTNLIRKSKRVHEFPFLII